MNKVLSDLTMAQTMIKHDLQVLKDKEEEERKNKRKKKGTDKAAESEEDTSTVCLKDMLP